MQTVDQAHLLGLLFDRSSCPLLFVLRHRETEQLLDAVVVRLPRRRFLLHRGPHGATICGCVCAREEEPVTSSHGIGIILALMRKNVCSVFLLLVFAELNFFVSLLPKSLETCYINLRNRHDWCIVHQLLSKWSLLA